MPVGGEDKDGVALKAVQCEVERRRRDWIYGEPTTTDAWEMELRLTITSLQKETDGLWGKRGTTPRSPNDEERRAYCLTLLDMAASCLMAISFEMKDVPATEELTGWLRRF